MVWGFLKMLVKLSKTILRMNFIDCKWKLKETFLNKQTIIDIKKFPLLAIAKNMEGLLRLTEFQAVQRW